MTTELLQDLKTAFKVKKRKDLLVERSGYSRNMVNMVLSGTRENHLVLDQAKLILEEELKEDAKLRELIQKVSK